MAHQLHRYGHWARRWTAAVALESPSSLAVEGYRCPSDITGWIFWWTSRTGLRDHSCRFPLTPQRWIDWGTWRNVASAEQLGVFPEIKCSVMNACCRLHLQPRALGERCGKVYRHQVPHDTLGWNVFKVFDSHVHPRGKKEPGETKLKETWQIDGNQPKASQSNFFAVFWMSWQ